MKILNPDVIATFPSGSKQNVMARNHGHDTVQIFSLFFGHFCFVIVYAKTIIHPPQCPWMVQGLFGTFDNVCNF